MAIALGGNQINKAYLGTTEIQKMYLGGDLVFDNSIQPSELTPVMSNFRIEDANKDRVYFDVVGDISTMTTDGFEISGKTISAVDTVNNYFTVTAAFNFWDNNTIRLGENSDTFDGVQVNPTLDNFTLSYITNNIPEPTATVNRYVAVGGSGDGTSEGNAASLSTMETDAVAGQTWWIKAGNYGTETIAFTKSGSTDSPIKYIGYIASIGDITANYLNSASDIINNWSDTVWPTLIGTDSGTSINIGGDFIIIRNIQSRNHQYSMQSSNSASNVLIERFNQKDNSVSTSYSGISLTNSGSNRIRIKDTQTLDIRASGVLIQSSGGGFHLIEGNGVYTNSSQAEYYISTSGSNSIIRNNVVSMPTELSSKHGIGIKATGSLIDNNWNLIELNEAYGMAESYYVRNNRTYYNVIKDNYAEGANPVSARQSGGIYFWGGSRYNIFERNLVKNMGSKFIQLQDNNETPYHDEVGAYNIVRNNIFDTSERRLLYSSSDATSAFNDNQFYNNTFLNVDPTGAFYDHNFTGVVITNLSWKNNIFDGVPNPNIPITGMTFDKNTFVNCGTWADPFIDADNVDIDPQLDANYLPANESLKVPTLPNVLYDYNSKERNATETTIGGVTLTSESAGEQPPVSDINYYVSNSGLDTNPGTELEPWQTLVKVKTSLSDGTIIPGQVVAFKRGDTWNEYYYDTFSGTAGNPITFTAYGSGDKPIFNANTVNISTWSPQGGDIWMAATPNEQLRRMKIDGEEVLGTGIHAELGNSVPDLVKFYYDNANSNLYIFSNDSPDNHILEYGYDWNGKYTFRMTDCNYLTFDNLDFRGGYAQSVRLDGCNDITINNCAIGDMSNQGIVVEGVSSNLIVTNSTFDTKFTLDYSNTVQDTKDSEVRGGNDGIDLRSCDGGSIYDNTFKNWGHSGLNILSIDSADESQNLKVYSNTFTAPDICYGNGMGTNMNSSNNEIYNNTFIDCASGVPASGDTNHYHHNIFKDTRDSPIKSYNTGYGMLWQSSTYDGATFEKICENNILENNIIIDCENGGLAVSGNNELAPVTNNIFRNNITYNCGYGITIATDYATFPNDGNTFENNSIYSSLTDDTIYYYGTLMTVDEFNLETSHSHTIAGNIPSEPLFVAIDDYHQLEASPTVNAGTTALATLDYDGNVIPYPGTVPDIGIYESDYVTDQLGPELVTNGSFTTDTEWEKYNGTLIEDGVAKFNSAVAWDFVLRQNLAMTEGTTYRVQFDIDVVTSGAFGVALGSLANDAVEDINTVGHHSYDLTLLAGASFRVAFVAQGLGAVMNIDNVSVKEVL